MRTEEEQAQRGVDPSRAEPARYVLHSTSVVHCAGCAQVQVAGASTGVCTVTFTYSNRPVVREVCGHARESWPVPVGVLPDEVRLV